jgi:hypothetical protein
MYDCRQSKNRYALINEKEAARLARFERATCGFEVRRSIQLSYRRAPRTF